MYACLYICIWMYCACSSIACSSIEKVIQHHTWVGQYLNNILQLLQQDIAITVNITLKYFAVVNKAEYHPTDVP